MTSPLPAPAPASAPVRREALTIFVRGLRIDARIGVYEHEMGRWQPLVVDVELSLDCGEIHRLSDTVNYETIAGAARANADLGHVGLVEEYAERLARDCLADPRVLSARVRVDKPEAIPGAEAAGCEVTLVRE